MSHNVIQRGIPARSHLSTITRWHVICYVILCDDCITRAVIQRNDMSFLK